MLSITQTIDFAEQAACDAKALAKAATPTLTDAHLAAFAAGVREGYQQAIADLKRHGYKFSHSPEDRFARMASYR